MSQKVPSYYETVELENKNNTNPTKTNADRIRGMSNHDLSRFLCGLMDPVYCFHHCPAKNRCYAGHNGLEDWLQQPVKEDECESKHT